MLKTEIKFQNGKPMLSVNGKLHPPVAYTSYFEERGEFSDFIKAGYRIFFVNVSFNDLPINNYTGFTPFRTGVFEGEEPDYSEFESTVNRILAECPDALIFPRIHVSMPRKWITENPDETVATLKGGFRESLFSDAFRRDGAELLKALVSHIRSSRYAGRVAGYHLCGGLTQEWMHHDGFGSYSEMGMRKFKEFMLVRYGVKNAPVPSREEFEKRDYMELTSKYGEFCCEKVAETIDYFSKTLKELINGEQVVGVFYGYCGFVNDFLLGLHGLSHIISSPNIDFFSSPCCYDGNRNLGIDWGDMVPADSLKHHGKLYFVECDVRTHLTKSLHDCRPDMDYPKNVYTLFDANGNKTVWSGPDTKELSLSAIRKAFAHQLTKASGIWWFDMWGGWYHDEEIMAEIQKMKVVAELSANKKSEEYPLAETAVFIDEKAYANLHRRGPFLDTVNRIRVAMGNTGIPFDIYMVEDAREVLAKYKAAIFTAPVPSESGRAAVECCEILGVPYLSSTTDKLFFESNELREFLVSNGIHCYNSDGCVVYVGGGYLGIHSVTDGGVTLTLPRKLKIKSLFGADIAAETDAVLLNMPKHHTAVFEIE